LVFQSSNVLTTSDLPEHVDDVSIDLRYVRRSRDLPLGKVSLNILDTELGATHQAWHPVLSTSRDGLSVERVGELDLKYKLEELVILMSHDYAEIRKAHPIVTTNVAPSRFQDWPHCGTRQDNPRSRQSGRTSRAYFPRGQYGSRVAYIPRSRGNHHPIHADKVIAYASCRPCRSF
jgi:hypothetical protein